MSAHEDSPSFRAFFITQIRIQNHTIHRLVNVVTGGHENCMIVTSSTAARGGTCYTATWSNYTLA